MDILTLLRALQFGDSLLPVGAFSFSNGLESAIQQGIVRDAGTLAEYVRVTLDQAASADGIALLHAHRAALTDDLGSILAADRVLYNRKLNQEFRTMTTRMGKKLAELAVHITNAPLLERWLAHIKRGETPGTYPACLGLVAGSIGLSERDSFALHQYGVAMMVTSASLRLMKITHLETQSILFDVNRDAESAYARIADATLQDIAGFAPYIDILAAHHVNAQVRMFMN